MLNKLFHWSISLDFEQKGFQKYKDIQSRRVTLKWYESLLGYELWYALMMLLSVFLFDSGCCWIVLFGRESTHFLQDILFVFPTVYTINQHESCFGNKDGRNLIWRWSFASSLVLKLCRIQKSQFVTQKNSAY